jgi:GNAT superfamily N-acetyltransferase
VRFGNGMMDCKRWGLARAAFMRVMSGLDRHAGFHLYRLFVRPIAQSHPPIDLEPRISIRAARPHELYQAARDPGLHLDPHFIGHALARGDRAYGAFDGADLVAYAWRSAAAAPHLDGLWVRVGAPCGYAYKIFTRASHRGRRLAAAVSLYSDVYARERGHTFTVEFVEVTNYASLSVERIKGSRAEGYVGYVRCFGRNFTFRSLGARRIGFEFCVPQSRQPSFVSVEDPSTEQR